MALARAREISSPAHWFRRLRDRAWLVKENILAPLALPAGGGLLAALMVFAVVLPSYSRVTPTADARGFFGQYVFSVLSTCAAGNAGGLSGFWAGRCSIERGRGNG